MNGLARKCGRLKKGIAKLTSLRTPTQLMNVNLMRRCCTAAWTSPLSRSAELISLRHERVRRYSACPRHVSSPGRLQRLDPKDKHTWLRCKERTVNIWSLVFPCANMHQTMRVVRIGRWRETDRRYTYPQSLAHGWHDIHQASPIFI